MRRLSLLLILLMAFSAVQAQRISHTYNNVSLSEALLQLNNEQSDYAINFLHSIGKTRVTKERLLFPIPQTEMDANSLMTQNPGY